MRHNLPRRNTAAQGLAGRGLLRTGRLWPVTGLKGLLLSLAAGLVACNAGSCPVMAQGTSNAMDGTPVVNPALGLADSAELSPHEGEIRLEGKLLAVDTARGTLTLSVTSFALPSGGARRLDAPKAKAIVVSDLTLLHVRGDAARPVTLGQLKDEVFAVAIGHDMGSGQALPARRVAVWNRVEAGSYRFDGAARPVQASPAQASPGQPDGGAPEGGAPRERLARGLPTPPTMSWRTAASRTRPRGSPAAGPLATARAGSRTRAATTSPCSRSSRSRARCPRPSARSRPTWT